MESLFFRRGGAGLRDQGCPEHREQHPCEAKHMKLMVLLWTCDTSYKLIFHGEYDGSTSILIRMSPGWKLTVLLWIQL